LTKIDGVVDIFADCLPFVQEMTQGIILKVLALLSLVNEAFFKSVLEIVSENSDLLLKLLRSGDSETKVGLLSFFSPF